MISRKSFILCTCFCAGLIMSCVKGLQIEIWNNTGRDIVVLSGEKKRIIKVGYHAKITRPNENDDILVETEGRRMMFKFIFPPALSRANQRLPSCPSLNAAKCTAASMRAAGHSRFIPSNPRRCL